jgi:hypothetical protein
LANGECDGTLGEPPHHIVGVGERVPVGIVQGLDLIVNGVGGNGVDTAIGIGNATGAVEVIELTLKKLSCPKKQAY